MRLDQAMVGRGLAETPALAAALIMAGRVNLPGSSGPGRPSPGMMVRHDQEIAVRRRPTYVSRGGDKLEHALAAFGIDPAGVTALDVGASTGGFTDCLLRHGAAKVYAVDAGRGQLHSKLRADPRVVSMEKVNARTSFSLPEMVDLLIADVSFISLRVVLGTSLAHLKPGGLAAVLVKPQFEAESREVGPGGVIKDPQVHAAVLGRMVRWAVDSGIRVRGLTSSPLLGDEGNREFFLLLEPEPAVGAA